MTIADVPTEWKVDREADALLKQMGDIFIVSHRNADLEGAIHVVDGNGDATDIWAEITDGDDTLESLWLSSDDFDGDVETVRDEVIDEFEHWLEQYRDYE